MQQEITGTIAQTTCAVGGRCPVLHSPTAVAHLQHASCRLLLPCSRIMFGFQIDQAHETLLVQCSACAFGLCSGAGANLSVLLQAYGMHFADANGRPYMSSGGRIPKGAPVLVGSTEEIEELRPKSPPPGGDRNQS